MIRDCRKCGRQTVSQSMPREQRPPGALVGRCRQLCARCYLWAKSNDTLIDYERLVRTRDEVLDDWDELRRQGYTRTQAAERMGMTLDALDRALNRAKKAGDPRAKLGVKS